MVSNSLTLKVDDDFHSLAQFSKGEAGCYGLEIPFEALGVRCGGANHPPIAQQFVNDDLVVYSGFAGVAKAED